MTVTITARKFKAHDTLKDFIKDEVLSLERFYDDIANAEVVLSYQNPSNSIKTAEIILHVPGQTLTAAEESDDFKKSVTSCVEKISKQLSKLKTKKIAERAK